MMQNLTLILAIGTVLFFNGVLGMETTSTNSSKQSSVNLQEVQNTEWSAEEINCGVDKVFSQVKRNDFFRVFVKAKKEEGYMNFHIYVPPEVYGEFRNMAFQLNDDGRKFVRFLIAKRQVSVEQGFILPLVNIPLEKMHGLFVSFREFRDKLVPQITKGILEEKDINEDKSGFLRWLIQEPWVFDAIRKDCPETVLKDCLLLLEQYSSGLAAPKRKE